MADKKITKGEETIRRVLVVGGILAGVGMLAVIFHKLNSIDHDIDRLTSASEHVADAVETVFLE